MHRQRTIATAAAGARRRLRAHRVLGVDVGALLHEMLAPFSTRCFAAAGSLELADQCSGVFHCATVTAGASVGGRGGNWCVRGSVRGRVGARAAPWLWQGTSVRWEAATG
jgi:hypothetical protein